MSDCCFSFVVFVNFLFENFYWITCTMHHIRLIPGCVLNKLANINQMLCIKRWDVKLSVIWTNWVVSIEYKIRLQFRITITLEAVICFLYMNGTWKWILPVIKYTYLFRYSFSYILRRIHLRHLYTLNLQ
jgi:hypothetical protein